MRLFGGATYFAIFLGGATFCHLFWWCDIFVIFNFVWEFLPSFSARGFKTALLTNFVSKTACEIKTTFKDHMFGTTSITRPILAISQN